MHPQRYEIEIILAPLLYARCPSESVSLTRIMCIPTLHAHAQLAPHLTQADIKRSTLTAVTCILQLRLLEHIHCVAMMHL